MPEGDARPSPLAPADAAGFAGQVSAAWHGRLPLAALVDCAGRLEAQGHPELAVVLYQAWLARNPGPQRQFAQFNLGVAASNAGDLPLAREAYRQAIAADRGLLQAHFNLGLTCERLGEPEAAIAQWSWLAEHASPDPGAERPFHLLALNNLGRLLENLRRYGEALARLEQSLAVEPHQPDVLHHLVFLRARTCRWPVHAPLPGVTPEQMVHATSAMAMIALSDDPAAQLEAARQFVRAKLKPTPARLSPRHAYGHRKLRLGYLSSDLCLHPVAMLTAELFELHDRERFEVHAYDWSREDGSALRARVIRAFDHFHRIGALGDEAAARLIRAHEIDILVDLQGQTLGARPEILAFRPAPIQLTYLGLPATTGLPSIDYVIADRYLIPESQAHLYSEKPLYLPDIYQCSDRKRVAAEPPPRASVGLPDDAFVFCCFNNNYKYTPEMFEAWVRILQRTPGSVLWLLADNPQAEASLRKAAAGQGLDPQRLVFATRTAPEAYLARYAVADLFLDTFPFNAGTTANDALWMGLPVLTRSGRSFASRMAGALLTAAGLPELITGSLAEYEDKAVALAAAPDRVAALRAKLGEVRRDGVLFDTARFTRNLERELVSLAEALPRPA